MNVECFPFLRLNWQSADYPHHQFDPLGLVSTLGSRLGGTKTSLWAEFPSETLLSAPWRMSTHFKVRSLGLCLGPMGCFYFRHYQFPFRFGAAFYVSTYNFFSKWSGVSTYSKLLLMCLYVHIYIYIYISEKISIKLLNFHDFCI